ncbi:MAG: DNA topoisomerase IB [Gemmatimonas sp.]
MSKSISPRVTRRAAVDDGAGDIDANVQAAACAGLVYVSDEDPGIRRVGAGEGFSYRLPDGSTLKDKGELVRIRSLAIPPAWTDVWICLDENGHIQATGRDAKGRKQYRYHPRWREVRDADKYEHMIEFARALPAIRARVAEDMARRTLCREKVLATVVYLLENTLIRVGNGEYAKSNKSYGLTTLRNQHADVNGGELRFAFKGKSGKVWKLRFRDRRIARIVRACQHLPGQRLFQYVDDAGELHPVTSQDVNAYLREISGADISAKDFRTWSGTVLAAMALVALEPFDSAAKAKRLLKGAIEQVAQQLGNTVTICRKCYIHPEVVSSYLDASLAGALAVKDSDGDDAYALTAEEAAVLAFLERRLAQTHDGAARKSAA